MKTKLSKFLFSGIITLFATTSIVSASNFNNDNNQSNLISTYKTQSSDVSEIIKQNKYDGRELGLATSVKTQGEESKCWTYATASALEANILKQNLLPSFTKETLDINEKNIDWVTNVRTAKTDPLGLTNVDLLNKPLYGDGYIFNALNSLMQWNAPISEATAYDTNHDPLLLLKNSFYMNTFSIEDEQEESGKIELINRVKEAIVQYGGVAFSFTIYGELAENTYYNGDINENIVDAHACTIVGWDDTISKSSYNPASIMDGGWIVKNSWGTSANSNGYFYMSYDSIMTELCAYELTTKDSYQNNYYYDGQTNTPFMEMTTIYEGDEIGVIFPTLKASETLSEKLTAINLGTFGNDVTATIKIYTGVNANLDDRTSNINDPSSGTLQKTIIETFKNPGHHTIDLEEPITLNPGENFSIVVSVTNEDGDAAIMLSSEPNSTNDMTYYKENNKWNSTSSNSLGGEDVGNLVPRIKAFTNTSIITNDDTNDSTDDSIDDNTTTSGKKPLSTSAIIGISVGGVGATVLIGSSIYFANKKRKKS